jgi:hypothetical protein
VDTYYAAAANLAYSHALMHNKLRGNSERVLRVSLAVKYFEMAVLPAQQKKCSREVCTSGMWSMEGLLNGASQDILSKVDKRIYC